MSLGWVPEVIRVEWDEIAALLVSTSGLATFFFEIPDDCRMLARLERL